MRGLRSGGAGGLSLTADVESARISLMQLKEFGKFLEKKWIPHLLHRARKESFKRIVASAEDLEAPRTTAPPRRTETR
jgi:hypothetical protein